MTTAERRTRASESVPPQAAQDPGAFQGGADGPTDGPMDGPMDGGIDQLLTELIDALGQVADGDFGVRLKRAEGRAGEVSSRFNEVARQLENRSAAIHKISQVVGREGRMTERLSEEPLRGTWLANARAINDLIDDLTRPAIEIARVIAAVAEGDQSQHLQLEISERPLRGEFRTIGRTVNTMVDQLSSFADEVTRVAREVGTDGKLGGQADVRGVSGTWRDLTDSVNLMASNLTSQVRSISKTATAIAQGDLSQTITVSAKGEVAELADTINSLTATLRIFADQVSTVAREVGTEGKLGGQADVPGVAGTWKDLTENVNLMASNLTNQVRNIAQVTTAVASGDLSQKITVQAQGEILELKSTVNTMVDQLSSFADEVTRVAREVGTEGELGGQAQVRGVSGNWKDLTDNVNQLASSLTTQLRAIAQVSTAVTSGDLTQRVDVDARGEVADLKDNINQMIVTLRETTKKNSEQNWLDSNLARIGGLLQGQRNLAEVCRMILGEVAPLVDAQIGAFFVRDDTGGAGDSARVRQTATYGYLTEDQDVTFAPGEGLVGQSVLSLRTIRVASAPEGYLTVRSGLGNAAPKDVVVLPVVFEGEPLGVIELGSFATLSELHIAFLERLVSTIGVALNTIMANRRTEELLSQSQRLARELQDQSVQLQHTNVELEEQTTLLLDQKRNIEINNREIETARRGLEEKAQQLSLASQYKSEFLANMSHELRTPLNSLLLLSRLLAENGEENLTDKQTEFARVIHRSGSDLLALIDDILDLSKIEAGRMTVAPVEVELASLHTYVESAFRMQAEDKGLRLRLELDAALPGQIVTDPQRLQQILRNLLSNAVKFTHEGTVTLAIEPVAEGRVFGIPALDTASSVIAFGVRDTGIGIPPDKVAIIFEAFQQADGTTSRKYGGTGLGLSISRELAKILGGVISAESTPGAGSAFTLYLPSVLLDPTSGGGETTAQSPIMARYGGDPAALLAELPPTTILRQDVGERRDGASAARLAGTTVLIVDDDIRNVFALTSALELHGMTVLYSDNGADGITKLAANSAIDVVLMDAMMPTMDGNETTLAIRAQSRFAELPIVFLTAKAMPGDREKALAAGASDYITKPVDLDELLDLLAAWVLRRSGPKGDDSPAASGRMGGTSSADRGSGPGAAGIARRQGGTR